MDFRFLVWPRAVLVSFVSTTIHSLTPSWMIRLCRAKTRNGSKIQIPLWCSSSRPCLVRRTSVLENISSSRNSATPNLLALASAKAAPISLVAPPSLRTSLRAITIGEEMLSVEEKSRSSTCWILPGDAYERRQTMSSQFPYPLKSTLDESVG